ncbi:MAG: hypothetical protein M3O15_03410 [Acidobacteriota bacterium]|nr:hypothetical protein [Acidobacteriota bacterium]
MSKDEKDAPSLASLIATLALPDGSKVPDPADGRSTLGEYDRYFRIVRDSPSLLRWTRTCLDLLGMQLRDLSTSNLDWQEKCQILEGMLLIHRITLEKWAKLGAVEEKEVEG